MEKKKNQKSISLEIMLRELLSIFEVTDKMTEKDIRKEINKRNKRR